MVTYSKSYVNPPGFQPPPHQRRQATVRPGPYQPLGGVTIRRRSAARGCADAHTDPAPLDGNSRSVESMLTYCDIWLASGKDAVR